MKRLFVFAFSLATFFGCKKDNLQVSEALADSPVYETEVSFAKALSKAVKEEPLLRAFLKDEALKQFDKDYDVLYFLVKDHLFQDGETVSDKILKYSSDKTKFSTEISRYPLLTIYVPVLPNFSAETWNAQTEIPLVAVSPEKHSKKNYVEIFDDQQNLLKMEFQYAPAFPILVVKQNERVIEGSTQAMRGNKAFLPQSDFPVQFAQKEGKIFSFISKDFEKKSEGITARTVTVSNLDPELITAYNSGNEWQRDYIYYGITPTNPNGVFSNHFSEFVRSFTFPNPNDYYTIADQANDPTIYHERIGTTTNIPPIWTQGNFEIKISVLINAKNGTGQELQKIFTVSGADLFVTQYREEVMFANFRRWILTGIVSREYYPNIELIPWDLEQYGSAWKFIVSEYDPAEEVTRTVTNTSTYGANFGLDPADNIFKKLGAKFGLTSTNTSSTTYTYKTTTGSDDLGEGILDFRSPIITGMLTGNLVANTYEVTTGRVSMSIEPKRVY